MSKCMVYCALALICAIGVGCSVVNSEEIQRIAMIAPFEGRYSEIGYNAYYAARMAVHEQGSKSIELLALDDGGSIDSANNRIKALASDPLVKVILALGYNATDEHAQQATNGKPIIIIGQWNTLPVTPNTYLLSNSKLQSLLSPITKPIDITKLATEHTKTVGGELFALQQFSTLLNDLSQVEIISSSSLPTDEFQQRYLASAQYVPKPNLTTTLVYDAMGMALVAIQSDDPNKALKTIRYNGLNGTVNFVDGYWAEAPINHFQYDAKGNLTPIDGAIE